MMKGGHLGIHLTGGGGSFSTKQVVGKENYRHTNCLRC